MRRRRDTPDFTRSSKILRTSYHPGAEERALADRLLQSGRAPEREALGQRLLGAICQKMRVPPVRLRVIETPQPHTLRGGRLAAKLYGVYHFEEPLIQIAHFTAIREKVVAGKTFLDTLLHEFMHHLDRKLYRLPSTPHSPGFYSRIEDLKAKLCGPGRPVGSTAGAERWARPPRDLLAALERAREEAQHPPTAGPAAPGPVAEPGPRRPRWTLPREGFLFPETGATLPPAAPAASAPGRTRPPAKRASGGAAPASAPIPQARPSSSLQLALAFGPDDPGPAEAGKRRW